MDSLPDHLFGLYDRYKRDTSIITSWLVCNGKICGAKISRTSLGHGPSDKPSERKEKLRGRARKLARDAAATQNKTPLLYVPTKDFERLATAIATSIRPVIETPDSIVRRLDATLRARIAFFEFFSGSHIEAFVKDKNNSHWHFITILQNVRDILSHHNAVPIKEVRSSPSDPLANLQPTTSSAHNAFATLAVDTHHSALETTSTYSAQEDEPVDMDTSY